MQEIQEFERKKDSYTYNSTAKFQEAHTYRRNTDANVKNYLFA